MFGHVFVTRLKCTLRSRGMMFWSLVFPLLLATVFNLCFANLQSDEIFVKIKIAVVDNAQYRADRNFQTALDSVSGKGDAQDTTLFSVTYCTQEAADNLLKNGKISGYLVHDGEIRLVIKKSGMNQTLIKEFLDQYNQTKSAYTQIAKTNPAALQNAAASGTADYLKEVSQSGAKPDTTLNYFYALIAMACLFGSYFGLSEVTAVQANQSPQGARVSLAPVHKLKIFACSLAAVALLHFLNICVLLVYLSAVLGVDFGQKAPLIVLAAFASSVTGVLFGAMVGALVKKRDAVKQAVLTGSTLFLSFLSGLMAVNMKYIVTNALPFMAYVNPANVVDDAFYSLYCYDDNTRYFLNLGLLGAFSALFFLIVYFVLRRQRYESL